MKSVKDRVIHIRNVIEHDGQKGVSQDTMSKKLGISIRSYQKYEGGEGFPGFEVLQKYSNLGFNANWILTGEGDVKHSKSKAYGLNIDLFVELLEKMETRIYAKKAVIPPKKKIKILMDLYNDAIKENAINNENVVRYIDYAS